MLRAPDFRHIRGAPFVFAIIGCIIARVWPGQRWRLGAVVFLSAALLAQVVEPALEVLMYEHRVGYDVELARWMAFGKSILSGALAYATTLTVCVPQPAARAS